MAQLPGGDWLMQRVDGIVILFHRHTEEELVRFDPTVPDSVARAQRTIAHLEQLDLEQCSFAHFWSGYFHAYATMGQVP